MALDNPKGSIRADWRPWQGEQNSLDNLNDSFGYGERLHEDEQLFGEEALSLNLPAEGTNLGQLLCNCTDEAGDGDVDINITTDRDDGTMPTTASDSVAWISTLAKVSQVGKITTDHTSTHQITHGKDHARRSRSNAVWICDTRIQWTESSLWGVWSPPLQSENSVCHSEAQW